MRRDLVEEEMSRCTAGRHLPVLLQPDGRMPATIRSCGRTIGDGLYSQRFDISDNVATNIAASCDVRLSFSAPGQLRFGKDVALTRLEYDVQSRNGFWLVAICNTSHT
jgi:hypothetical protein